MHSFKDNAGQVWQIDLTFEALERVFEDTKIDLLAPHEGTPPLASALTFDLRKLYYVLRSLLTPQRMARGLETDAFAAQIGGKAIADARAAFLDEWQCFFQTSGLIDAATGLAQERRLRGLIRTAAAKRIEAEAEKVDVDLLIAGPGKPSGDLPGSVESQTSAASPSEN